jgi:lipoyl(octanoyl) transferase
MFLTIRDYPSTHYIDIWREMRQFTDARTSTTPDEIWLTEHFSVYTQGQSGKTEHVLNPGSIPIIQTDRGGQVTYHGPGQIMVYALLDIQRRSLNIRGLVTLLEQSVIALLADFGVLAHSRCEAPGVYVADAKICSVGLRVRRGRCYHGLALNANMDLSPFAGINPCGYRGLKMTQLAEHIDSVDFTLIKYKLLGYLVKFL